MNTNLLIHFIKHYFSARRKGHGVHSPFVYRLCEEVFYNSDSFYHFSNLNTVRESLLKDHRLLEIEDFGAGSKTFKGRYRKVSDIAAKGISGLKQSELLYKLSNFLNCRINIELGTSLGLNALYLASVNRQAEVITLEGSKQLVDFATNLSKAYKAENIRFVQGHFDSTFPTVLASVPHVDLLYIDGNHTYDATLRYFQMALSKKNEQSVFVFDDIYWSKDMTKAWQEIKNHPEVKLSLDSFHFGMIFFRKEFKEQQHLRLYVPY